MNINAIVRTDHVEHNNDSAPVACFIHGAQRNAASSVSVFYSNLLLGINTTNASKLLGG